MFHRLCLAALVAGLLGDVVSAQEYRAGVARTAITPAPGLWLGGYAARTKPAEGKAHDIWVKALALEDPHGERLVLVTADLLGLPHDLAEGVAAEVKRRTGLPREKLLLSASHTHCAPVLRGPLVDMYEMPDEQLPLLERYRQDVHNWLVAVVVTALDDLKPARLAFGRNAARFAANRRMSGGPVDHDVPVLSVTAPDGRLRAVVFGYACHNTTLQFYQYSGDYAGFAQDDLEDRYPGAAALFWAGCGGDANPAPRGTLELARRHGRELAGAVQQALESPLTPVRGEFRAAFATIALPHGPLPSREQWQADLLSKVRAQRVRARRMLAVLDAGGKVDETYPYYPVQVWRLGDQVVWIALGGEVVVDYALRLKRELGADRTVWVMAYANDVMAYIPSVRVLREGGYEGEGAMVYYGLPTKWAPDVEELIVRRVHELVGAVTPGRN
jgi:hypothetical protein